MVDENKFVTHDVFNTRERKIYQYIDRGDQELKDLYHKLDKKLELDQQRGEQTIKQQDKMIDSLDKINSNLTGFDKRVSSIETQTRSNTDAIQEIKATTKEKKMGAVQVTIAIITALGGIFAAAIGFAQVFF
ncbi:hypothetical protein [Staphylococcus saprophyticus]|uniref:hypothetical protein n=1 Tax=Staphylococcus saprophyticus TaxID=29385 RepID=UPI003017996E